MDSSLTLWASTVHIFSVFNVFCPVVIILPLPRVILAVITQQSPMSVLSLQTGAGLTCNHPRLGGIIWISWRIYEDNLSVLGGFQVSMSTPCVCLINPREVYPLGTWMESNSFFRMAFFNGFLLTLHEVCRFHKRLLPCWRHQGEWLNIHEVCHRFFIIMVDVWIP